MASLFVVLTLACDVGVNTAIYSPSGANSGVGFAIPVDALRRSVEQIIQFGKVVRPILGISFAPDQSVEQVILFHTLSSVVGTLQELNISPVSEGVLLVCRGLSYTANIPCAWWGSRS